jgi:mRNA-degrading endonuclease RelE of RelBE toxin-antitoxin system
MSYKVKTIAVFEKQAKRLIKKYVSLKTELLQLVQELKENPEQGTAIGKSCFKIRIAIASKGKGKSGGARIIANIVITDATVYLLSIYDKSEKENLTDKELDELLEAIPN